MAHKRSLTPSDHKRIGRLLKRGYSFDAALEKVQGSTKTALKHRRSGFHTTSSIQGNLRSILDLVTMISAAFEVIGVLTIFATYGFGFAGLVLVLVYLVFWEIVGGVFDAIEVRIPRPFRILWEVFEELVGIAAPGP